LEPSAISRQPSAKPLLAVATYTADGGGKLSKSVFMKSEDEASQLNRLGETGQAPSLLQSVFVGASRQYCVFRIASSF
jgi:hypothetical protein